MDAKHIIELLGLQSHPMEGGYFRETYRSSETIETNRGSRSHSTAIYYLLTPETFSAMHRLPGDEVFHFYAGDPVEMLQLMPDGSGQTFVLGTDLEKGMRPQLLVPGGVWQGTRLVKGGTYALLGTTMSPGFASEDYEAGDRSLLCKQYPRFAAEIEQRTR